MANRRGKSGSSDIFYFLGLQNQCSDCSHEIRRHLLLGRKAMRNLDSISKSRDITLPTKVHRVTAMVFPVVMNRCESWIIKTTEHQRYFWITFEYFWIVVMEKTLESPLDSKEIKPVNHKENQAWIFIGRTDAETLAPILWPPNAKSRLTGKDSDAGKDRGQEMKGATEAEMVGWHHRLKLGMLILQGVAKSWTWLRDWTTTDVRKYNNWAHKVGSWKYLSEDLFCQFSPEQLSSALHSEFLSRGVESL